MRLRANLPMMLMRAKCAPRGVRRTRQRNKMRLPTNARCQGAGGMLTRDAARFLVSASIIDEPLLVSGDARG